MDRASLDARAPSSALCRQGGKGAFFCFAAMAMAMDGHGTGLTAEEKGSAFLGRPIDRARAAKTT